MAAVFILLLSFAFTYLPYWLVPFTTALLDLWAVVFLPGDDDYWYGKDGE